MTTPPQVEYRTIELTKGKVAYVSPHRYEELNSFSWYARRKKSTRSYYAVRQVRVSSGKRITVFMHREILGLKHLDPREGDHRNRNSVDNTDINLEVVGDEEQSRNRGRWSMGASGYKGVSFHKNSGRWRSSIGVNGKSKCLGYYRKAYEAHLAYCYAASVWYGEFACFG